jgi:hypothetical protein
LSNLANCGLNETARTSLDGLIGLALSLSQAERKGAEDAS